MRISRVLFAFALLGCRQVRLEPELLLKTQPKEAEQGDGAGLSVVERRGRDLWFKATAGSERWHTYGRAQRLALPNAWNDIFNSEARIGRFQSFGVLNDPDCRRGNTRSYGWDICPGDEGENGLLTYLGAEGWQDSSCELNENDVDAPGGKRTTACALHFGTSAGVIGFRKFPNPRFRKEDWPGWEVYDPSDAAIEPPFLVGITCAACHAGFDPLRPPRDVERPRWENIRGTVGNPFLQIGKILSLGLDTARREVQILAQSRANVVPRFGKVLSIHDLSVRPPFPEIVTNKPHRVFEHEIKRWRFIDSCVGQVQSMCRCVGPKCWLLSEKTEPTMHMGMAADDVAGADLAVQRAFVEMGSCAETCLVGQEQLNVAQCRRDCPEWRAIEDRVGDILAYLLTPRAPFLADALGLGFEELLASKYIGGRERWELGRQIFAQECAHCHSSQKPQLPGQKRNQAFFETVDFHRRNDQGQRIDWLGNDEIIAVTEVGTNRCRALNSTHTRGQIWEAFATETYRSRAKPDVPELAKQDGGGRGYYRNVSLLGVWTHAPFFHTGMLGPEKPENPSVAARLATFERSAQLLLNPELREQRVRRTREDTVIDLGLEIIDGDLVQELKLESLRSVEVRLPPGVPLVLLENITEETLVATIQSEISKFKQPDERWQKLQSLLKEIYQDEAVRDRILTASADCRDLMEDQGHTYGAQLSPDEKQALIAFLKTL